MSSFPCLVRFMWGSGQVRYRLGDRLVTMWLVPDIGPGFVGWTSSDGPRFGD
jgi:hypothetical protein